MKHVALIILLALTVTATAAATTRPAGFYWTTARATAAFKIVADKQQASILNGHQVAAACKGLGIDPNSASMTPDVNIVKGVKRYRTFTCTAVSVCFAAPWTVQIQTLSARLPSVRRDPLRIKLLPNGPAPTANPAGC